MKNSFKISLYSLSAAALGTGILALVSSAKISFLIGSKGAFFSLNQTLSPIPGALPHFFGVALGILCMRTLWHAIATSSFSALCLAYHIPTFFGSIAFSCINDTKSTTLFLKKLFLAILIIGCAILFIMHPVGLYAAPYTLLWLIPLLLLARTHTSPFTHALTSTFVAHAVGSVLWLYMLNTLTAAQWIGIMPIALIERLIFAAGTTICYYSMQALCQWSAYTQLKKIVSFYQ